MIILVPMNAVLLVVHVVIVQKFLEYIRDSACLTITRFFCEWQWNS